MTNIYLTIMDYSDQIRAILSETHGISLAQTEFFIPRFFHQQIKKNQFLIKPGQVSNSLSVILEGSFRVYREMDSVEHTLHFFTEKDWIADHDSFVAQKPSENFIQAIENS